MATTPMDGDTPRAAASTATAVGPGIVRQTPKIAKISDTIENFKPSRV